VVAYIALKAGYRWAIDQDLFFLLTPRRDDL